MYDNEYFDPSRKGVDLEPFIKEKRLFLTSGFMTRSEAHHQNGEPPKGEPYPLSGEYLGYVVTSKSEDWNEAEMICLSRPWNETVKGLVNEIER